MSGGPLAADLSLAVDAMELAEPGTFGDKGAYGQAYALLTSSTCAAACLGPLMAGALYDAIGFANMTSIFGLCLFLSALPIVSTTVVPLMAPFLWHTRIDPARFYLQAKMPLAALLLSQADMISRRAATKT